MFTGLIQAVGSLRHTEQHRGGLRWWVDAGELLADGIIVQLSRSQQLRVI